MEKERFLEIIEGTHMDHDIKGDKNFLALEIMHKYVDSVLEGADHDIVYGCDIDDLIEGGMTEEEALLLAQYGWHTEDDDYMASFV